MATTVTTKLNTKNSKRKERWILLSDSSSTSTDELFFALAMFILKNIDTGNIFNKGAPVWTASSVLYN